MNDLVTQEHGLTEREEVDYNGISELFSDEKEPWEEYFTPSSVPNTIQSDFSFALLSLNLSSKKV